MSISEIKMGRVAIVYGLQNMHRPNYNIENKPLALPVDYN
jgi:hypothetical protein